MRRMTSAQLLIAAVIIAGLWTAMAVAFGFRFWPAVVGGVSAGLLVLGFAALYRRMPPL